MGIKAFVERTDAGIIKSVKVDISKISIGSLIWTVNMIDAGAANMARVLEAHPSTLEYGIEARKRRVYLVIALA